MDLLPAGSTIGHGNSFTASVHAWRAAPRGRPRPSPVGEGRSSHQPHSPASVRRLHLFRRGRLRRDGCPAAGERAALETQLHPARAARPGEDAVATRAGDVAGRRDSRRGRLRDPRQPVRAAVRVVQGQGRRGRRRPAHRVAGSRRTLRREARHARRDDRGSHRRRRPDQGRAQGPRARRRADDALRAAAAGEPRDLRDQRAAGSRRQDPGRPLQHPSGRRRAAEGLPRTPAAGRPDGLHGEPRGLHRARQDHHAAQGSARRRDPHALRDHTPDGDGHHGAGSLGEPIGRARRDRGAQLGARSRRGSGVPGSRRSPDRQAVGRQPAHADLASSKPSRATRNAERSSPARRPSSHACRISTRPCRR